MMNRKKILNFTGILFLISSANLFGQESNLPIDSESNLITYSEVIKLENNTKNALYDKAYNWCNNFYKNPKNVIRKKDVLNGEIECKGRFRIVTPASKKQIQTPAGIVQYTLLLEFKENRYKYTLSEINWRQSSYYPIERWLETEKDTYLPVYVKYLNQVDQKINETIESLVSSMAAPVKEKADDW